MEVKILGIVVGTATGWDEVTDWGLTFYDFKPVLNGIPEGDLFVDFQSGDLQITDTLSSEKVLMHVPAYGFLKQVVEHA
jgi:hypothetical protein